MVRNNLALMYERQRRYDDAESLFRQALAEHRRLRGDTHPNTLLLLQNLARVCAVQEKWDHAATFAREAITGARKAWGDRTVPIDRVVRPCSVLSEAASHLRKPADHRALVDELIAVIEPRPEALGKNDRARVLAVGGRAFDLGHFDQAVRLYEIVLRARRQDEPEAWTTFNAMSLLGGALLGQKKYDEAAPLLLEGYQGMKQREKAIPPQGRDRIPEALDRLIEFYTVTKKPDEAKKYKAERKKYPDLLPPPMEEK